MSNSLLNQPHFTDPDKAREYLERVRWPDGPICPHCGSVSKDHYALKGKTTRPGLYKCSDCREQFTVTVGTVFERSKVPLNLWLQATHLMCSSKKGISSHQIHRTLGVTYKTAWFMTHRIREAMTTHPKGLMGGGGGKVEADETFWGNNKKVKGTPGRGYEHKMKVLPWSNVPAPCALSMLPTSRPPPSRKSSRFAGHEVVKHSKNEYSRPGGIHTNTVEGYFSLLKRGLIGTFHKCGEQHLHRYANEFSFRYNHRVKTGVHDPERTDIALKAIGGKRLTYRRIGGQQEAAQAAQVI